ncbi:hypothetical protein [Geminocystis sp. GBBB08]|nr:hypothetical protein [Geminocystis sp. GBBB08]
MQSSASSYKTTQINPQDELENLKKIIYGERGIQGLMEIDQILNTLIKVI